MTEISWPRWCRATYPPQPGDIPPPIRCDLYEGHAGPHRGRFGLPFELPPAEIRQFTREGIAHVFGFTPEDPEWPYLVREVTQVGDTERQYLVEDTKPTE